MLFVKKLPWASLLLLLFTYGVFGWLISDEAHKLAKTEAPSQGLTSLALSDISWFLWLMGAVYILLIALTLTAPFRLIQSFYTSWLKSDTRAFISVIFAAFVAVIIITWIDVFVRILVLISASALVRLDLQTAGYSKWQAFWILITVGLMGFGLGAITHQLW
jgi:hypothetical protein